jgi:hypothetical protein
VYLPENQSATLKKQHQLDTKYYPYKVKLMAKTGKMVKEEERESTLTLAGF